MHPSLHLLPHRLLHPLALELVPPLPLVVPPLPDPYPWLLPELVPPGVEAHHRHRRLALLPKPQEPRYLPRCRTKSTRSRPLL